MKKDIIFCNKTDIGRKRKMNEDYYGYFETPHGELFIVTDGMGGYGGGEIASTMAVDIISEYVKSYKGDDLREMLEQAIQTANKKIYQKSLEDVKLSKMGTTVVVLLIHNNKAIVAHVGDSRCYLWRRNKIVWVTKDHTKVQHMVDRKIITPEQAKTHPERNILLQAVGSEKPVEVEFNEFMLSYKDRILLCTDGLYEYIENDEMENLLSGKIDTRCEKLVDVANKKGGEDNITVQIIEYIGAKPTVRRRRIPVGVAALVVIAFFAGLFVRNILKGHKLPPPSVPPYKIYLCSDKKSYYEGDTVKIVLGIIPASNDTLGITLQYPTKEGWEIKDDGKQVVSKIGHIPYKFESYLTKEKEKEIWFTKQNIAQKDTVIRITTDKFDTTYYFIVLAKPEEKPKPSPPEKKERTVTQETTKVEEKKIEEPQPTTDTAVKIPTETKEKIPIEKEEIHPPIKVDTNNITAIYDKRKRGVKTIVPVKNTGVKEVKVVIIATIPERESTSKQGKIGPGEDKKVEITLPLAQNVKEKANVVVVEVKVEDKQICKKEVSIKF